MLLRILTRMHSSCVIILFFVSMYAFAISYAISMHIGSTEEITLLEFHKGEEGEQQEIPQAVAPEGEEPATEELPECPDHRPTSFLKGRPRSILSLLCFTKYT